MQLDGMLKQWIELLLAKKGLIMTIVDVEKMTVVERLRTLEAIWDSLAHGSVDVLTPPEWHREILTERIKDIRAGTAKSMTLEELAARKHA